MVADPLAPAGATRVVAPARADRPSAVDPFHAVVLVSGVGFGLTAPFTALLVVALGGSQTAAAVTVASMGVSLLVVDVLGSRAIPRLGSRWVLSGSSFVFGVGSLLSVLAPTWEGVLAARVLQGLGAALFMGGGVHLAVRRSRGRGQTVVIGAFNAAWFAGIAVGPLGGGLIAASGPGVEGLRTVFAVCAVVNVVAGVLGWVLVPSVRGAVPIRPSLPRGLGVRGRRAWTVLVLAGVGQVVRAGVAMTLVPLVGEDIALSWTLVGVALFLLALTDIAAMRLGSRWAERHGRRPLLLVGFLLGAVLTAVLWTLLDHDALGAGGLAALSCALGATVGLTWTLPAAMAVDVIDDSESAVSAYRIACDVGMVLGGGLLAATTAAGGLSAGLLGAALLLLISAGLTYSVGETRRPDPHHPHHEGGRLHALPVD